MGDEIPKIEAFVSKTGVWGALAFVLIVAVCTSAMVPDTLFAVAAGALFGLVWGTLIMLAGALTACCVCFFLSRRMLSNYVARLLATRPRIATVAAAAAQQGLKFQILLRLTPLSPVAVSYALGTTKTRFGTFILACVGIIPGLFVEVYFGYAATHAAKLAGKVSTHPLLHHIVMFSGLAICLVLMLTSHRSLAKHLPKLIRHSRSSR